MNDIADHMAGGGCQDHEEYIRLVGKVEALALVERDILDLEKRLEMRSLVKNLTLNDLIDVSQKYLFNESKKSVIAGKNYIDEMKKMNFEIKNI